MSMRQSRHGHRHSRQLSVDYPKYLPLNTTAQHPSVELMPAQTSLAPVVPSDYDSDNQGYASDYPVVRTAVNRTKDELNLSVLQRLNPDVRSVLSIAPFVTLYEWAPGDEPGSESGWQKTTTVGSLFICQLCAGTYGEERYFAILLNRGGDKNFSVELRQSEALQIEIQGDFIIVMRQEPDKSMELKALFIYAADGTSTAASRAANGELIVELAKAAQNSRAAAEQQIASYHNNHDPHDLPQATINHSHSHPELARSAISQPSQANDLLALLQSPTPIVRQAPPQHTQTQPQPESAQNTHSTQSTALLDLFRQAGQPATSPSPATATTGQANINDLFRQAGLRIG